MYVLFGVIFILMVSAFSGFGQKSDPRALREELHRRMIENLFHGTHDDDLFRDMDKLFDDAMRSNLGSHLGGSAVETSWTESASGRTLLITPSSPEQKLDIDIQGRMVTIKGKSEVKTPQGTSHSDFSSSFSVPPDVDPSKVKLDQKNGKITAFFPWSGTQKRAPLPKGETDVSI